MIQSFTITILRKTGVPHIWLFLHEQIKFSFATARHGKHWIQTSGSPLKNGPCVTFCSWRRGWVNQYKHTLIQTHTLMFPRTPGCTPTHIHTYIYIYIYNIYIYIYISIVRKNVYTFMCAYVYIYAVPSISLQTFFVQAFKIVVDSSKFNRLLLYILWDDWPFLRFQVILNSYSRNRIHPTEAWLSQLVNFDKAIWTWGHFRRTICNKILF